MSVRIMIDTAGQQRGSRAGGGVCVVVVGRVGILNLIVREAPNSSREGNGSGDKNRSEIEYPERHLW